MRNLLVLGLLSCAVIASAEETGVLRPGYALGVSVTFDKQLDPGPIYPLQYLGGILSCEMAPPGTETGLPCPEFSAFFAVKDNLGANSELEEVLRHVPETFGEDSPKNFWLDPDRKLRYRSGDSQFSLDISSYFLPGTVVHQQWKAETDKSDLLFLVAETCDAALDCRSGLWLFSIQKGIPKNTRHVSYRPWLAPLLGKVDGRKLATEKAFGLHKVGERFAILVPVAGAGAPVVAWVANIVESSSIGVRELGFDVYPARLPSDN